jgi:DNA-binding NarL/FixJ family response regulator
MSISVVLADDHPIVRQGLRSLLEDEDGCRVIGEATDGLTAIDLITELRPEVAILDVQLPDLGGLEVARRTRERSPETRVVMLSMHADEPYVLDALRHGALGYVLKGAATTDLIAAVHAAVAGRRYLSPPLADRAFDAYARRAGEVARPVDRYELLTAREREVLQLGAQGLNNSEIGERLAISPRTAETHRANLLRKLGLQSQTELVRFAIGRGLLPGSQ